MKTHASQPLSLHEARTLAPGLADLEAEIERTLRDDARPLDTIHEDQASRLRELVGDVDAATPAPEPPVSAPLTISVDQAPVHLAPFTIAIASGKGGVGKTNITVNLAAVLASRGYRVTVLDADLGTANADVLCGLTPTARLDHVLSPGGLECHDGARRTLRDIVIEAPGGFRLIPGSAGISRMADLDAPARRRLFASLSEIDHDTDILLIDTSAGVGRSVTAFLDAADICLVIATPEPTAITDAYALIKCASSTDARFTELSDKSRLARCGGATFRLVINQSQDLHEAKRVFARIKAVCTRFLGVEVALAGWIAQDVRVPEAVRARQLFYLRSPAAESARNVSELARTLTQDIGPPACLNRTLEPPRRLASGLRRLLGLS